SKGRTAEAEALMTTIEMEVAAAGPLPPVVAPAPTPSVPASAMLRPPLLERMVVGGWVLVTLNTLIFGFVRVLAQFVRARGLTITSSLGYTVVLAAGSLVGCAIGAFTADFIGRRWSIIGASVVTIVFGAIYASFKAGADPILVLSVGFVLIVAIYVQTAILF